MPLLGLADGTCWFLKGHSMAILVLACVLSQAESLPRSRHGLRVEGVGISAYFDDRRTDLLYFLIVC